MKQLLLLDKEKDEMRMAAEAGKMAKPNKAAKPIAT